MSTEQQLTPGEKLQQGCVGTRLSMTAWGITREMDSEYKEEVANRLEASQDFLSLKKKLVNTKNPYYKKVTKAKSQLVRHWHENTIPYVEKGIRLLQKEDLNEFQRKLQSHGEDLNEAVRELDAHRWEVIHEAEQRQGRLFKQSDYPASFVGLWGFEINFPELNPPGFLMQLNPSLYEEQAAQVRARFEATSARYEQLSAQLFQDLLHGMQDALKPAEDGSRKAFRDSTVRDNLVDALAQFKKFSVNDQSQLNQIAGQIEQLVSGIDTSALRASSDTREEVAQQAAQLSELLKNKIGVEPRRRLLIPKKPVEVAVVA